MAGGGRRKDRGPAGPTNAEGRVEIRGTVERVTFRNEENLYTVLKLRVGDDAASGRKGHGLLGRRGSGGDAEGLVTAVGTVPLVEVGGDLAVTGSWTVDSRFGEQFRIEEAVMLPPVTIDGIERYLGSGLAKGIGKEFARRLVRRFGVRTLEVIESDPDQIRKVPGIGPTRAASIVEAWQGQKAVRDVMVFLHSHGATPALASRIFRRYGKDSIAVLKTNPYVLAGEVHGVGFLTADRIARSLGTRTDAPERIAAGLLHAVEEASSDGHCFLPRSDAIEQAVALLEVDPALVEGILPALVEGRRISIVPRPGPAASPADDAVYPARLEFAEAWTSRLVKNLLWSKIEPVAVDVERAVRWAEESLGMRFARKQRKAVETSLSRKVSIITGGPGTGKTTIVKAVASIIARKRAKVMLCAPTGRAAKRLSEATGMEASTIHRLLGWSPREARFTHDESSPLRCDLLVVDETSMVDVSLMHDLLRAVRPGCRLVLVGDADQLPSVGPGSVLRDLVRSRRIPSVRLDEIFRQAGGSLIVENAHRVNTGRMPVAEPGEGDVRDFYLVERKEPPEILATVLEIVSKRIPDRWGFDPVDDVQVLTPMHRGPIGAGNLNREIAQRLNPGAAQIQGARGGHRIGDKVMQIRNNYDLEVWNGDIGRVVEASAEDRKVVVDFDGHRVAYDFDETDEIVPAYAVSIHKSQGSEFKAVVVVLSTSHYVMLQRNLLYTAISRGRKLVVLVGSKKAVAIALRNDKVKSRHTMLCERIRGEVSVGGLGRADAEADAGHAEGDEEGEDRGDPDEDPQA